MKIPQLLMVGALLLTVPAWADKPNWAGGKPGQHEKAEKRHAEHGARGHEPGEIRVEFRFGDDHRRILGDYYGAQIRAGHCPPGLAKKKNGCLPPGQAKKWRIGQPLPASVVVYDLPAEVLVRLPPPPPRHRYVRVAGDILLIAIGTSLVIDALEDIVR